MDRCPLCGTAVLVEEAGVQIKNQRAYLLHRYCCRNPRCENYKTDPSGHPLAFAQEEIPLRMVKGESE